MTHYPMFDSFLDVILVVDAQGRIHYGNSSAAILFETSSKRLSTGKDLSQFISFVTTDSSTSINSSFIQSVSDASQMREFQFKTAGGLSGLAQVTLQRDPGTEPGTSGTEERWILYMRDVSLEKILQAKYRAENDQKEAVINDLREARVALEVYSKNLEGMVGERTSELSSTNQLLKTVLDSLGQGILVFTRDGRCLPVYSQICRRLLETDPNGQVIEDVLRFAGKERDNFEKWREAVFDELLEFRDMVPLAPSHFKHSEGLEIALGYYPMRDEKDVLYAIVLVATDKTMEFQALRKAEHERVMVAKVTQVARNRDMFRLFVLDARKLLQELRRPEELDSAEIARRLHTLKGAAASFALGSVAESCHRLEDDLKKTKGQDRSAFNAKLKNQAEKVLRDLDHELDMLSELLGPMGVGTGDEQHVEVPLGMLRKWSKALLSTKNVEQAHEVGIQILRESSEKNVGSSVQHLVPSLVELAESLNKTLGQVDIVGGDVRIPSHFAQGLLSSLVHSVRNSVYHGLEERDERVARGKPAAGKIVIAFARTQLAGKDCLSIQISDDGRGVDPKIIREKLLAQNQTGFANLRDEEVIQAVLRDDFSTSKEVNAVAGRGVGLAAIASEARRLGGTVRVHSELGQGMRLDIVVPLPRAGHEPASKAS